MESSLVKMFPKEGKVTLKNLPNHVFTIKKFTLDIDAWMINEFGSSEAANESLMAGNPETIMKFFYKLLSYNDKLFLKNYVVELDLDENGEDVPVTNMIKKLLLLCHVDDIDPIIRALLIAKGYSLPEVDADEQGKKKARSGKKK